MVRKWIKSTLCATVGAITLIFATPQQSQAQANLEIVFIDSLWGGGIGAVSGLGSLGLERSEISRSYQHDRPWSCCWRFRGNDVWPL
jgi:hypothetical protein